MYWAFTYTCDTQCVLHIHVYRLSSLTISCFFSCCYLKICVCMCFPMQKESLPIAPVLSRWWPQRGCLLGWLWVSCRVWGLLAWWQWSGQVVSKGFWLFFRPGRWADHDGRLLCFEPTAKPVHFWWYERGHLQFVLIRSAVVRDLRRFAIFP